ncbi:MAG: tetratricopeptide repeat protein, partial [Ardenticatenales bacterium]|nr:tetratricopeptide repeat protein [Ardenticatenales bacterium]
ALALADFDRVLEATPDDPQLHYWRAYVFWQRREWDRMQDAVERLEALNGQSPLTWELRGHLLIHESDFARAEAAYTHAIEGAGQSPDLLYNRAVARRQLGHYPDARADLEAILLLEPDNPWARLELSNFAFTLGEYEESLRQARAALVIDSDFFEARISEAATLMALGEISEARLRLETMRETFPNEWLVEQLYGDVLSGEGETEEAAACYRRVLAQEPENHLSVRLRLAGALMELGHYEEAEEEIERLLLLAPEGEEAYATRADLYRYTNRPDAMRADLDHLLTLNPENAWALTFRAAHCQWTGDMAGALADYRAALAADSSEAWIWAFRGQFHLRLKQIEAARNDFQRAITLDPEDPWIRRQWAALLQRTGQQELAAEVLDCLIEDAPDDGFARLFRAELYLAAEEWEKACEELKTIVEIEHELSWLAHAALAAFATDEACQQHLTLAETLRPEPSFWGMTPATVLGQSALVAWQRGEHESAVQLLSAALEQMHPGEILWCALHPLCSYLKASPLLALLQAQGQFSLEKGQR